MNDFINDFLTQRFVSDIGFAKCTDTPFEGLQNAVSMVFRLSDAVVEQINDAPTHTYFQHYRTMNAYIDSVSLQLVMALYRFAVASSGAENLTNIRFENFVVTVLRLTLDLVAVALVVDCIFMKCTGQRRPSGGGIAAAWGRMMATGWL
ncbi:MAG: hypothetical protein IJE41_01920, partial [Clostridia bacterium]|nr:hypothetical protein [Clostridia bacterium]